MVEYQESRLNLVFHALSDPTRRALLRQLAKKECNVSELAEPHELTLAGISKHLKVLEAASFVEKTRDGRTFRCRANLIALEDVYAVLEELGSYWRNQLDSLEQYFLTENLKKGENTCPLSKKMKSHRKSSSKK